MKKFLAKLALFSIVSLMLISISSAVTYAAESTTTTDKSELADTLAKGLDDAKAIPCIVEEKPDGSPGDDDGYIITIIEEPLNLEKSAKTTKDKVDFESRICYRNYLSFVPPKKSEIVISILATDCSEDIKSETFSGTEYKDYKVTTSCKPVQVFLSKGGTTLITGYISLIYKWAASIVGVIAVTVIVISGVQISVAGGDSQAIDTAKGRIIKSISGIIVLFLSGLILYTINPNFFVQ
ncbi:MAG: hypothetical protein GWP15_02445 [Nitrospirae bacterium]|nr:hypothetical protein [Nitrospirota bacterium]